MAVSSPIVRAIQRQDYDGWRPLWDGYNAFYGRVGATALPAEITAATWERFFTAADAARPARRSALFRKF